MGGASVQAGALAERLVRDLGSSLAEAGFDLLQPFSVGIYNQRVEPALRLEDFGSASSLGVVIGNTRALWPRFLARLQADAALRAAAHPLEQYTEKHIGAAVKSLGVPARVRWSHDTGGPRVAMQRLAHAAGLAYLSESHLSVHPCYGPWIALRAAVSFAVRADITASLELSHPCGSCEAGCLPAFERALAATGDALDARAVQTNFPLWLAVRDACPTGRAHRYDAAQIRYHYLVDREQLFAAAAQHSEPHRTHS